MLIVGAEVAGAVPRDLLLRDGRIAAIGPRLPRPPDEETWDARGGVVLPGLHDHHIHLFALAAALASLRCGPPEVRDAGALERALRAAPLREGWIRGVAYHESVAGSLDRRRIDAWRDADPVRIQHRTGALWMLNSAALARLDLDREAGPPGVERDASGRATGRLFRLDAWLRERQGDAAFPSLAPVGGLLARAGVTGVTDAGADNDARSLERFERARASRELPQRVFSMGNAELAGGPRKILLDEVALPPLDDLAARIREAHAKDRAVAFHCATRVELAFALAALEVAGPRAGDRIEHASVAPPELAEAVRALGLTVVTQPSFVAERGDQYREDVEARDLPWLYRARAWLARGVPLAAGSDAPYGAPDPWRAMRAAVGRRTEQGRLLGSAEALTPEEALALFTSSPEAPGLEERRVSAGERADLCVLRVPWREARLRLSADLVASTWIAGELVG